jgi:hypothetical protein
MDTELWTYRSDMLMESEDISGFSVEASDGGIGQIDETSREAGAGYIVVDTGPWIFGKKVMIPAGAITDVDLDDHRVYLDLTKEQVKNSPLIDENTAMDEDYRSRLGSYYETIYPPR